jgi:outer membrane protein assembly factor BamA
MTEMQDEANPTETVLPSPPSPSVIIASVQFAPGTHISDSVRNRVLWSINSPKIFDDSEDWLQEMQDVGIRGALQDSGYYRAKVKIEAHRLKRNEKRQVYALTLHIEEGWRYKFRDVQFKSLVDSAPLAFPESELRKYVHMKQGDFFNTSKVREALNEVIELYNTNGYIDMVPAINVKNDDDGGPLDIIVTIDQGKQYHIGTVEFIGLDQKKQDQLRPELKEGQVFNPKLIDALLVENKSVLPADASRNDLAAARNTKDGVVNLSFDFRSCPSVGESSN